MNLDNVSGISLTSIYSKICGFYLFSIICLNPYGIKIAGDNSIRFGDILITILVALTFLMLIINKKIHKKSKILIIILPFVLLEIVYPIIGYINYSIGSPLSSIKVLLMYIPIVTIILIYTEEKKELLFDIIEKALKLSLLIQLLFSTIQILVVFNYLPRVFLIQEHLSIFAVDGQYKYIDGVRASGLTNNGIELSLVGTVGFSYFASRIFKEQSKSNFLYLTVSVILVLLSTTRAAVLAIVLIGVINFIIISIPLIKKIKIFIGGLIVISLILFFIKFTIGLDTLFYRFIRIGEGGLENDFSFNYRSEVLWPSVINTLKDYPLGTLVQPFHIVGLIDSGYLSYYAQGKILFILALFILLIGCLIISIVQFKNKVNQWNSVFLINLIIYILISMYFYNTLRSPLIIFSFLFSLSNFNFIKENKIPLSQKNI